MLNDESLDLIFRKARSHNKWRRRAVSDEQLMALYELMKWGPTCANGNPCRIVFCKTDRAKEELASVAAGNNVEKILAAPVTAVLAYDLEFYSRLPELFSFNPHMKDQYENDSHLAETTAFRNGSLQGAYFIVAARSIGLDCGPMSGFDNLRLDDMLFPDTAVRSNFICSLGYGDSTGLFDRLPRLEFEEVCTIR